MPKRIKRWAQAPAVTRVQATKHGLELVMEGISQWKDDALNIYETPKLEYLTVWGWKFLSEEQQHFYGRPRRTWKDARSYGWLTPDGLDLRDASTKVWNPCNDIHIFAKAHGYNNEWQMYDNLNGTNNVLTMPRTGNMPTVTTLWEHLEHED